MRTHVRCSHDCRSKLMTDPHTVVEGMMRLGKFFSLGIQFNKHSCLVL